MSQDTLVKTKISLFKAQIIVNEIKKYYPELLEICKQALKGNRMLGILGLPKSFHFAKTESKIFN